MAVDGWAVTFGTVRRRVGGAAAHRIVGPRSRVVLISESYRNCEHSLKGSKKNTTRTFLSYFVLLRGGTCPLHVPRGLANAQPQGWTSVV